MFLLRDLPKYEAIRQRAARHPELDPRALEAFLVLLRVGSDVFDGLESFLGRHGMSQGKFTLLMLLHRESGHGVSPSDLADRSGVTRATITGLIDGLSREKLVVREGDIDDRRKAIVRLTELGIQTLDAVLPSYYQSVADLMGGLTDDEKIAMIGLLTKVRGGLAVVADPERATTPWSRKGNKKADSAAELPDPGVDDASLT